ncbi:MAG: peptide chain release factor N(5)-glutamine methyltransferase [Bergeyella sp.]|nr:peptide chain release factor N(5)-glutamine methyltransferase [Bergeyella sp.]
MKIRDFRSIFIEKLKDKYSKGESIRLLKILAEFYLKRKTPEWDSFWGMPLCKENENKISDALIQLQNGKPYQQIIGETYFYGLKFWVNESILIPRPETEELLELSISRIQNTYALNTEIKILDIGTGSGVIPIILKKKFPKACISALDISKKAIILAKHNAKLHNITVDFRELDYLKEDLSENFHFIISNPPYIDPKEQKEISDIVKHHEPYLALFPPSADPLTFYKKIYRDAKKNLLKNGAIFLEINQKYGLQTKNIFVKDYTTKLLKDISGNDRFVIAEKK